LPSKATRHRWWQPTLTTIRLSDYVELFRLGTDAANKDSDGDGYNDGTEVELGSGPLDSAWVPAQPLFAAESVQLALFGFRMSLVTPAQGETLVIEKSSDLHTWERFVILPNPARTFELADPGATDVPRTFYRAVRIKCQLPLPQ
jgi:hypothetical protein